MHIHSHRHIDTHGPIKQILKNLKADLTMRLLNEGKAENQSKGGVVWDLQGRWQRGPELLKWQQKVIFLALVILVLLEKDIVLQK